VLHALLLLANGVRDDRWEPLLVTGNANIDQGAAYIAGLHRFFVNALAGYANDTIAHELGHHIHHVRSGDLEFDTTVQKEVAEGIAGMFAYDFNREDATLGEDGLSGKNALFPIRGWDTPSNGQPSLMSQYQCNSDVHFNSTILSHAYCSFVQEVAPDVAGYLLYQVPAALGRTGRPS